MIMFTQIPWVKMQGDPEALKAQSEYLETLSAAERVAWAHQEFGDELVMSTSFGVQSAVMLHLVTQVVPNIPVIFIDTGYLFAETYRFADALAQRLRLNLKTYQPLRSAAQQEAVEGKRWEMDAEKLEAYNFENKVEPMNRALKELGGYAWLAGLRREQSNSRQELPVVQTQRRTVKIHPILDWNSRDIYQYLKKFDLPYHPLWDEGYVSVGDWHSTRKLDPGMTEEQTRFNGVKRECGLHEVSHRYDFHI
ncbi:MAG: phosphoadenylyl-sulfate reductase [Opitutales bacterium]